MAFRKLPSGGELFLLFLHLGLLFTSVAGQKIYQDYAAASRPKTVLPRPGSPEFNASIIIDDTADAQLIGHLGKRVGVPTPDAYGPAFDQRCLICPKQELLTATGQELLDSLQWYTMITYMRKAYTNLKDKCVFYTAGDGYMNTPSRAEGLSVIANQWACSHGKYSIWNLWPNSVTEAADPTGQTKDFYSCFDSNNWLNPILSVKNPDMPSHVPYFQQMSKAMAEQCSGEWCHEWTTLRNNYHRITRLVGVDISPGPGRFRSYELDLMTLKNLGEITGTGIIG
ncbi:hypothetical protein B0T19DRAFT_438557 [Cercophora scortea]|uniref:Uncharacterized protein n=1 Tax=Cercophora scortea TaxID=314031 RepID=A0AAE0MHY1_9PEZI|nr:hypothetical protein B0T19DRAFT_438557 [Cercophora scortea]